MPLQELSSEAALKNLKSRSAIWPQRGAANRKGLLPLAELQPTFSFADDDLFFCLGSCFAQHVGCVLSNAGYAVATNQPNPLVQGDWGGANHLIRYNVFAMLNEFRWALDPATPYQTSNFCEEDDSGKVMDPFGHSQWQAHQVADLTRLRAFTGSVTKSVAQCRIVIITLGLVEVWYDKKLELYTNIQPGRHALRKEPGRYVFRVLDYKDILEGLEGIHALLTKFGHPDFRILLTTSPVPLHATLRGQDIFTANTYSKSVQRAATEEFLQRHANVNYFPSYEAITLGSSDFVWKEDQRHVTEPAVQAIMEHVLRVFAPQKGCSIDGINRVKALDAEINKFQAQSPNLNMTHLLQLLRQQHGEIERLRMENKALKTPTAAGA